MEAERHDESYVSPCHFLLKPLQLAGHHTTCYLKSEKQCRYTGETNTKVIRIVKDMKSREKETHRFKPILPICSITSTRIASKGVDQTRLPNSTRTNNHCCLISQLECEKINVMSGFNTAKNWLVAPTTKPSLPGIHGLYKSENNYFTSENNHSWIPS